MAIYTYCGDEERFYPHITPDGPSLDAIPGEDYELDEMPDDGLWHTPHAAPAKAAKKAAARKPKAHDDSPPEAPAADPSTTTEES
jgi:hypothetical protein